MTIKILLLIYVFFWNNTCSILQECFNFFFIHRTWSNQEPLWSLSSPRRRWSGNVRNFSKTTKYDRKGGPRAHTSRVLRRSWGAKWKRCPPDSHDIVKEKDGVTGNLRNVSPQPEPQQRAGGLTFFVGGLSSTLPSSTWLLLLVRRKRGPVKSTGRNVALSC